MRLYSIALLLSAAAFLLGGIELMAVGGSWFYAITGAALVVSAVLVWRGRRLGSWLIGALFAATLGWALWESGFDAWALLPRVWFIAVLGAWLVILEWRRRPPPRAPRRPPGLAALASAAVAVLALAAIGVDRTGPARSEAMSPTAAAPPAGAGDWMTFGRTPGGTRFSPLGEITPANVGGLRVAWTYRVGETDPHGFEATPLKVADSVYLCTGGNLVVALDAETGAERWRFDPRTQAIGPCRGVAYYRVPAATGVCAERIFSNVFDGRLIALDARTGERCAGFGRNGEIALTDGMRPVGPKQFMITSVPTVARGRVVVGGTAVAVKGFDEPSGVIRAFDAVTGALAWAYDAGQPERTGEPGQGTFYTVGMPNSWSQMAYDDVLGLVYVPTATGGASYYGAQRRPVDDEISTAIMALDVTTGRRRWLYQFVHHDLWDYDVAAQPLLVDVQRGGQSVKALVQTTKMGETFVLDRATGVPIDPVAERPVPQARCGPGGTPQPDPAFSDPDAVAVGRAADRGADVGPVAVRPDVVPDQIPRGALRRADDAARYDAGHRISRLARRHGLGRRSGRHRPRRHGRGDQLRRQLRPDGAPRPARSQGSGQAARQGTTSRPTRSRPTCRTRTRPSRSSRHSPYRASSRRGAG